MGFHYDVIASAVSEPASDFLLALGFLHLLQVSTVMEARMPEAPELIV